MAVANHQLSPEEEESNQEQQCMESEMLLNIYSAGEMTVLKEGREYTVRFDQTRTQPYTHRQTHTGAGPVKARDCKGHVVLACLLLYRQA